MVFLLGQKRAKYLFEYLYWLMKCLKEGGSLTNRHYQWVFTEGFGLETTYYEGKKILDVGCGPRGSLEWAPSSADCFGLDPLANQYLKLNKGKHRMKYVPAAAELMPFESNSFDLVSSFNSLDHVDDFDAAISEICRVLKPGGDFLLISDIHSRPALCEPTVVGWDFSERLAGNLEKQWHQQFRRGTKIYESIRLAEPYDGGAYGLLIGHFVKK